MSKDRILAKKRDSASQALGVPWLNISGETIPAYGVIQLRDDVVDDMSQASKPNASTGLFLVNGPISVAVDDYGESPLWTQDVEVLVEAGASVGDQVGPVDGSFEMKLTGTGYRVFRQRDDSSGTAIIIAIGQGGSGSSIIRYQIYSADCENRVAVCRILSRAGEMHDTFEIYGETELDESGATVNSLFCYVYDKIGAYFNESNINLFGREGHASYLYGRPRNAYQPWWAWEAIGISEQQTECEAF